ncbi:MAG: leucine-rich repeat domain-containing protein [Chloroflexota bacterium]
MSRKLVKIIMILLIILLLAGCSGPTQTAVEPAADVSTAVDTVEVTAVVPNIPTPITNNAFDCATVSEIPAAECQALVTLYEATEGANWQDQTGWLVTNTPCSWVGVTCADGHVDTLALFFNNLQGQLPAALAALPRLRVLDLHNNAITGSIPPEIGRLANLVQLDLSVNQLSGVLPAALGDLAALQWLMLPHNQISGPIPSELGQLAALHTLDLSHNQLSGVIPESLANSTTLATIRLRDNQLSGSIPFGLGQLPALYEIDLSFNQLTGSAPSALFQVGTHSLWGNQLDGTVFVGENGRQDVNFLGATFTFDQAAGDSVWPELVPARPAEAGPGMMWAPPEHIVFTFAHNSGPQEHMPLGQYLPPEGQIHIYPTAGLNAEVQPIVAALQQLLADQPDASTFEAFPPNEGAEQLGLTMLPPSNAVQTLRAQAAYLSFAEGQGIRYLTQLSQGPVPINNQDLFYTFQGLTDDGATYVSAYFPVTLPPLPDSSQLSEEEWAALMEDWQGYLAQTLTLLDEQPTTAFTPDLAALDAVINSLSVAGTTAVPTLQPIWPENEESVDSQPVLQWEAFPGAVSYHVVVLDDVAFPPQVVLDQTVTEPLLAVAQPLAPGHYSWTVFAQDTETAVLAQLNSTFFVKDILESVAPADGAAVSPEPMLEWQSYPGAVRYQVVVVDDAAYPPVVVLDEATTETSLAVTPALKPGSYTWTVWAFDGGEKLLAELNSSFNVTAAP